MRRKRPRRPQPLSQELQDLQFMEILGLIAAGARTTCGKALLESIHPWDGKAGLRRLHQQELELLARTEPGLFPHLDLEPILKELRSPAAWLPPEQWRALRTGLRPLAHFIRRVAQLSWPTGQPAPEGTHLGIDRLQIQAELLPDSAPLGEKLHRMFNEDGQLEPLRIPTLLELYKHRSTRMSAVQNHLERRLRKDPQLFSDPLVVERNGRFCLPLKADRRASLPGLVLDRSSSGSTLFMEPLEAVPLNNAFVEAERDYQEAVKALIRELIQELRSRLKDFEQWSDFLSLADQATALLRWQELCEGRLADLGTDLRLEGARHPLLLRRIREALEEEPLPHEVVPLDLHLSPEHHGLVISGSNTGGKTVTLKTVGLLWAMAASGLPVPVEEPSCFPPLPSLHADIGDHQSVQGSLSTFSSHILHLKQILREARPGGLVLLDELGTGTDPKEGAALGVAVLRALVRRHCWILVTTHLGEISQMALRHPRIQAASVHFDEEKLAPAYRLMVGLPGRSHALDIARRLGLPSEILDQAQKSLGKGESDWREFLRQLEQERAALLVDRERLDRELKRMEADKHQLEQARERLAEEQVQLKRDSSDKMKRILSFMNTESKRLVRELRLKPSSADASDLQKEARSRARTVEKLSELEFKKAFPEKSAPLAPELQVGQYARHRGLGFEGKVLSLRGHRVQLESVGGKRLEAHLAELEPIHRKEASHVRKGQTRLRVDSEASSPELNLIGRASDDIETEVFRFLEAAVAAGRPEIRIVHGHGTGRLKAAVREALRHHPAIRAVEDAPPSLGGTGATVVLLGSTPRST